MSANLLYRLVWSEWFWLPANVTWSQLDRYDFPSDSLFHPIPQILFPFMVVFAIVLFRVFFNVLVFGPIFRKRLITHALRHEFLSFKQQLQRTSLNGHVSNGSTKPAVAKEKQFPLETTFTAGLVVEVSKQKDVSEAEVYQWLRKKRRSIERQATKANETAWATTQFIFLFWYGLWALWDKPYLWQPSLSWLNYPDHPISTDVFWYYQLEMGYYLAQIVFHFVDSARYRSDFWQMLLHHVTTLFLIVFSWTANFCRIGVLIMLLHDIADAYLQAAKLAKNLHYRRACDYVFGLFVIFWCATRVFMYPAIILKSVSYDVLLVMPPWPNYYFLVGLLYLLYCLHLMWTVLILRVAKRALFGEHVEDTRSPENSENESSG